MQGSDDESFDPDQDIGEKLDEQVSWYMREDRVVHLGNKSINTSYWQEEDGGDQQILLVRNVFEAWVSQECQNNKQDESEGKFVVFGSYMLGGTVGFDYDVDAICIVPEHITSRMFFDNFSQSLLVNDEVKNLVKITSARAPIVTFSFQNVSFDLSYAGLPKVLITNFEDSFKDESTLKSLDMQSVVSISGYLTNKEILKHIYSKEQYMLFLKVIKSWAKLRSVNSNKIGFLNGISWAILVAKIYIRNPNLSGYDMIYEFFNYFHAYDWNERIYLRDQEETDISEEIKEEHCESKVYIGNPTYPYRNTCQNVIEHSLLVLKDELVRGWGIVSGEF